MQARIPQRKCSRFHCLSVAGPYLYTFPGIPWSKVVTLYIQEPEFAPSLALDLHLILRSFAIRYALHLFCSIGSRPLTCPYILGTTFHGLKWHIGPSQMESPSAKF